MIIMNEWINKQNNVHVTHHQKKPYLLQGKQHEMIAYTHKFTQFHEISKLEQMCLNTRLINVQRWGLFDV